MVKVWGTSGAIVLLLALAGSLSVTALSGCAEDKKKNDAVGQLGRYAIKNVKWENIYTFKFNVENKTYEDLTAAEDTKFPEAVAAVIGEMLPADFTVECTHGTSLVVPDTFNEPKISDRTVTPPPSPEKATWCKPETTFETAPDTKCGDLHKALHEHGCGTTGTQFSQYYGATKNLENCYSPTPKPTVSATTPAPTASAPTPAPTEFAPTPKPTLEPTPEPTAQTVDPTPMPTPENFQTCDHPNGTSSADFIDYFVHCKIEGGTAIATYELSDDGTPVYSMERGVAVDRVIQNFETDQVSPNKVQTFKDLFEQELFKHLISEISNSSDPSDFTCAPTVKVNVDEPQSAYEGDIMLRVDESNPTKTVSHKVCDEIAKQVDKSCVFD